MELDNEYNETMMSAEDYFGGKAKLFKKAGWDDLRFEFVLVKVISTVFIIKKSNSVEDTKRRLLVEDGESMVPNDKEIELVRKNIDRIQGWMDTQY